MNEDPTDDPSFAPPQDPLLEVLIKLVLDIEERNDGRVEEKITLFTNGLIICGTIISKKDFMLKDVFLSRIDEVNEALEPKGISPNNRKSDPLYFIHLRNAYVVSPSGNHIPANGMFWRGRLSSIDGFAIGHLKNEE
jgi:hypothetical protein